jgi:hypothetical protein
MTVEQQRQRATRLGRRALAQEIAGLLWPERYPPGHVQHNSRHPFWAGEPGSGEAYQWSADTLIEVSLLVERELES